MSEAPEEKNEQPQESAKGSRKSAGLVVAVVAIVVVLAVVAINAGWLGALSGGGDGPPAEDELNTAPEILSITPATDRITPLAVTAISCEATDPDGDELTYTWSASGGEIVGDGAGVKWTAPDMEGLYRVFVSVADGRDGLAEASLALRVRANAAPEILIMESEVGENVGWVVPGARVYVHCEAEDGDGDTLTYEWSATEGEVFGLGDAIVWIAPETLGIHWVSVLAEDSYGGSAERSIPITVNAAEPPAILGFTLRALDTDMFHPYGDSWRIFQQRSCAIDALVDDKDGTYMYRWSAEKGAIDADGPNAVWVAPTFKGWVNILLQVSDSHGNESSASVRLYVETCPSCMD